MRVCRRVLSALTVLFLAPPVVAQEFGSTAKAAEAGVVTSDANVDPCRESTCRQAPLRETLTAISIGTRYARAILGGFEQGAGIEGGLQVTSADAIPGMELRAAALTSTKLYRRFDLDAFVPTIGGSRTHADVWFSYLQRETAFYGIGPRTPSDQRTHFAIAEQSVQGSLYRDLAEHLQGGAYVQVMSSRSSRGKNTTDTPIDESFSSASSEPPERWLPGFRSNTRIVSYGGFLAYDARDDTLGLTRGVDLYGRVASAEGMGHQDALADFGWIEAEFDVRGHAPLGSSRTSLALRLQGQLKIPRGGGRQIPFYDLSWLGGRQSLRGHHSYRFRGNNALLLSTELQRTVYAITGVRGVDVFASADAGQVWGDARSSTHPVILDNQDFSGRNWRSGMGGGLQYRHSPQFAARVELSRNHERTLVYWSLSRGF